MCMCVQGTCPLSPSMLSTKLYAPLNRDCAVFLSTAVTVGGEIVVAVLVAAAAVVVVVVQK